jgi:hypothetical protein
LENRIDEKVKIDELQAVIALFRQQTKFAEGLICLDCIYGWTDSPGGFEPTSRPFV